MAICPSTPLPPAGWRGMLIPPVVAAALVVLVLATGTNRALFESVNAWPMATGDALWINLNVLGESSALLALSALFIRRRCALAWALLFAAAVVAPVLLGLKDLIDLARPARALGLDAVHVIGPVLQRNSFPSGHTTTVFAAAAVVWSLLPRPFPRAAALTVASLVGLSRLAVGAHWPLDVLCGAILGWLGGVAAVHLAGRLAPSWRSRWQWIAVVLPLAACVRILFLPEARSPRTPMHYVVAAVGLIAVGAGCGFLWHRERLVAPVPSAGPGPVTVSARTHADGVRR